MLQEAPLAALKEGRKIVDHQQEVFHFFTTISEIGLERLVKVLQYPTGNSVSLYYMQSKNWIHWVRGVRVGLRLRYRDYFEFRPPWTFVLFSHLCISEKCQQVASTKPFRTAAVFPSEMSRICSTAAENRGSYARPPLIVTTLRSDPPAIPSSYFNWPKRS